MAEQGAWLVLRIRGNKTVEAALKNIGRVTTTLGMRLKALGIASLSAFRGMARALLNFKTILISTLGIYAGFRLATRFIEETLAQQGRLDDAMRSMRALLITQTGDYAKAAQAARFMVQGLAEDAKRLPGEFEDFVIIMRLITGPLGAIGSDLDTIRETVGDIAMAASIFGENMEQAGEDAMRLLQGQALIRMELFRNLRSMNLITEKAEEWNKLTPVERYEKLRVALKALVGDQNIINDTTNAWTTQTSTLHDNLFGIIGIQGKIGTQLKAVVLPLIQRWNEWFMKNEESVNRFAETIGTKIAGVFEVVGKRFLSMIEDQGEFNRLTDKTIDALEGVIIVLAGLGSAAAVAFPIIKNGLLGVYSGALFAGQAVLLLGEALIESIRQLEAGTKDAGRQLQYLVQVGRASLLYLLDVVGYGAEAAGDFFKDAMEEAGESFASADVAATAFGKTLEDLRKRSEILGRELDNALRGVSSGDEIIANYAKVNKFFDEILAKLAQIRSGALTIPVTPPPDTTEQTKEQLSLIDRLSESLGLFFGGVKKGMSDWSEAMLDFAKRGVETATTVLDGFSNAAADAFADIAMGTKNAKEAMKDFFRSMVGMLVRTAAQLIITIALAAALQALLGNVAAPATAASTVASVASSMRTFSSENSNPTEPRAYDSGGVTNARGVYRTGSIREAHVPIPSGRIPVEMRGGGGSSRPTQVTFVMNVNGVEKVDGNSVKRLLETRAFRRTVKEQVDQQLAYSPRTRRIVKQASKLAV